MSRHTLARGLQLLGLIILPCGISANLVGRCGEGMTLLIAGGGLLVFTLGHSLQHGGR